MTSEGGRQGVRPPKQARSRRTLEKIQATARSLFSERDVRDVSLREIADTAEVSLSSLFARFASKDALLDHLHERHCEARLDDVTEIIASLEQRTDSPRELVREALHALVRSALVRGGLERSLIGAAAQIETISRREQRFQKERLVLLHGFVLRLFRSFEFSASEIEIESLIRLVLAAAPELIRTLEPEITDLDPMIEDWSELILRALGLSDDVFRPEVDAQQILPQAYSPPSGEAGQEEAEAILGAAELVFEGRGLSEILTKEFADAAGVTESTILHQFGDTRGLLHASFDRLAYLSLALVDVLAAPGRWEGKDLRSLVDETIRQYLAGWRRWGGLVRTVRLEERHDAALFERHLQFDKAAIGAVRRVALQVDDTLEERGFAPETFSRAVSTLAAGLRTAVERPYLFELEEDEVSERLHNELAELAMRYLSGPAPS